MHSAIYEGSVRHRRTAPVDHEFRYKLFMMYLDLDELPDLFSKIPGWRYEGAAPASFRRSDYFGPAEVPLADAVRDKVASHTGATPTGPIRMLTNLRYFGYCFNPVTFYYCFDPSGKDVEAVLAEITNTPWKERHSYVMQRGTGQVAGRSERFDFRKDFHVSPFIDMDIDYQWLFSPPDQRLLVQMDDLQRGDKIFDATLALKRREISSGRMVRLLLRHPCMTGKAIAAIYWQALRLRLKGCKFYSHPRERQESDAHVSSCA
ncbi:MAG: DUF1365 domain-containing protein [Planctomycetota bacterium]